MGMSGFYIIARKLKYLNEIHSRMRIHQNQIYLLDLRKTEFQIRTKVKLTFRHKPANKPKMK